MSDRDEDRPSEAPEPPIPELPELPPLDDGEPEPSAADPPYELDGGDDEGDGGAAIEGPSVEEMARELSDFEDAAWSDDVDGPGGVPADAELDEVEEAWADGVDAAAPLDDDWFADADDGEAIEDDGGAAGPLEEPDDAFADAEEEPEAQYLGPVRGRVAAVALLDGALLAAGDGLYRTGADGLLHRYDSADEIDAVSVCVADGAVLLGTERRGLLRVEGFARAPTPVGSWPSPLAIFGLTAAGRRRIVGLAGGDGVLLASDDDGRSWRSLIPGQRCLAAVPWEGDEAVLALVDRPDGPALLRGEGPDGEWRPLPELRLEDPADCAARISIAAAGGLIAVGSDRPEAPLRVSMDRGASFAEIAAVAGVTAIAVDPREPGWIAAATWDAGEGVGAVRVTRDGGMSWRTAFVTGRAEEREEPVYRPGRVIFLAVLGDDPRRICAVTGEGVYSAELPGGGAAH